MNKNYVIFFQDVCFDWLILTIPLIVTLRYVFFVCAGNGSLKTVASVLSLIMILVLIQIFI